MGHRATWVTESLKIWMQTLETVLCIFGMAVDFRNQGTEERHDISKRVQLAKQTTFNIHIEIFFTQFIPTLMTYLSGGFCACKCIHLLNV